MDLFNLTSPRPAEGRANRSALVAAGENAAEVRRVDFPGGRGLMIGRARREAKAQRDTVLAEHKDAILRVWKTMLPSATKDRVVLVEHKGDHVAVAAVPAKGLIDRHRYHLGTHVVDAIEARQPGEPFVVVLDWNGADAGRVGVHRGVLRFRS